MAEFNEYYSCDDVLLVPYYLDSRIDSRSQCDPSFREYSLPLIASCMDTVYTKELDKCLTDKKIMVWVHRYFKSYKDQLAAALIPKSSEYRWFAVGRDVDWIEGLYNKGIRHFVVDMAHGDSHICEQTVKFIKNLKDTKVIAGNVATTSGFKRLQNAGVWGVRVGIGSGSICSTRTSTGFGVPLLTSIERCLRAKDTAIIIADGGIKYPGDIPKAIRFGADMVVSGRLWAGTKLAAGYCYDKHKMAYCSAYDLIHAEDEANGCDENRVYYKVYKGMASKEARAGILKEASIEGVSGLIEYTGKTEEFIENLRRNMQSALSYGGAINWAEFRRNVKAIRITPAAWEESRTHVLQPESVYG